MKQPFCICQKASSFTFPKKSYLKSNLAFLSHWNGYLNTFSDFCPPIVEDCMKNRTFLTVTSACQLFITFLSLLLFWRTQYFPENTLLNACFQFSDKNKLCIGFARQLNEAQRRPEMRLQTCFTEAKGLMRQILRLFMPVHGKEVSQCCSSWGEG